MADGKVKPRWTVREFYQLVGERDDTAKQKIHCAQTTKTLSEAFKLLNDLSDEELTVQVQRLVRRFNKETRRS